VAEDTQAPEEQSPEPTEEGSPIPDPESEDTDAEDVPGAAVRPEGHQPHGLQRERDGERRHEGRGGGGVAQRPEGQALGEHGERHGRQQARRDGQRHGPVARERQGVGAGGDELAVGEVDEAQDAEDEGDPHRHERVEGALGHTVEGGLQEVHEK